MATGAGSAIFASSTAPPAAKSAIARAVAAASQAANKAGDGSQQLNRDDVRMLQAPLKMANGKPLRAQPTMDLWALGMIAYELFVNEPFFAGCSDDVALQVLAGGAPLDLPMSRIAEPRAEHLLAKMLVKRPKDRLPIESVLRHAYLVGGLDTQEVGASFAMLHTSQQAFKDELGKLQEGIGPGSGCGGGSFSLKDSFTSPQVNPAPTGTRSSFKRGSSGSALAERTAKFAEARGGGGNSSSSVLGRAGAV